MVRGRMSNSGNEGTTVELLERNYVARTGIVREWR